VDVVMQGIRKAASIAATVISVLLVAIMVTAIGLVIAQRRSPKGVPVLFGHVVLTLLSGSMTPTIDTGDLAIDKTVTMAQANNLHVGQIITFQIGHTPTNQPVFVTHRIVGVLSITNQSTGAMQHMYTTKGDANNTPDAALVSPSQVLGVYQWRVPYGGYVAAFIHTRGGFAIFIVLPVLYLIGSEFLTLWRRLDDLEHGLPAPAPDSTTGGADQ